MTPTNAATKSANRTSLLSWEAIAEPHVPDRGPPSIPPDRRPNISLRDAVKLVVWMRDVLGTSDHLEGFGQSARIERRVVTGVGTGGRRAQAFLHDHLR